MNKSGDTGLQAVLQDCSFSAKHNFNLLSMPRLLHRQGWKIVCDNDSLVHIENGNEMSLILTLSCPKKKGHYACKFVHTMEIATASTENMVKLNTNMAHCLLGHRNEDSMRKTARELGWILMHGMLMPCEHCARSKAKQKNVQKANVPWHRLYLDLSKVTVKSGSSENVTINCDNWKVLVCKATGKKWSDFTITKSDMVESTCKHFHKLKSWGIPVPYV